MYNEEHGIITEEGHRVNLMSWVEILLLARAQCVVCAGPRRAYVCTVGSGTCTPCRAQPDFLKRIHGSRHKLESRSGVVFVLRARAPARARAGNIRQWVLAPGGRVGRRRLHRKGVLRAFRARCVPPAHLIKQLARAFCKTRSQYL